MELISLFLILFLSGLLAYKGSIFFIYHILFEDFEIKSKLSIHIFAVGFTLCIYLFEMFFF